MRKNIVILLAVLSAGSTVFAQPNWLDAQSRRTEYPNSTFFTGFASDEQQQGETQNNAIARLKKAAQAYIAEAVRVQVSSETESRSKSVKIEGEEQFNSIFEKTVKTSAAIELTGLTTDSYVDKSGTIYAFAYVNKYELKGSYTAVLTMNMQQLESVLSTAKQLEANGEKAKARTQYEEAIPLLVKVEQAQDVLVALDRNASLQRDKTAKYRSEIIQALARLSQGVYIYIESKEDMFGKNSTLITNKIKSVLSKNGCSFTNDISQADFILKLNASARKHGNSGEIVFCYADVEVELVKKQTQKTVYQEELKEKGGHTTYENAAREAFEAAGKTIAGKLIEWVKN